MVIYPRASVTAMASFSTRLCFLFGCWWRQQTFMTSPYLKNLDLYPMAKTRETRSFISYRGKSFLCVLHNICFYLCDVLKKVIHRCMSVSELLNIKMFLCNRKTVNMMMSKMNNMNVEIKNWSEYETWNKEVKMTTIFDKAVKSQMKMMIRSDQMKVAGVLLSDWLACQSDEQDESYDGSDDDDDQTELSDEDLADDGLSEVSSEHRELWESFLKTDDPYNPLHFFCSAKDKAKHSDNEEEEDKKEQDPQEQNETEWSEEDDSDWSDEDLDMSAESRALWESFNSDPYNPLCFSCPTGAKTRTSEVRQDHKPSSPTANELENNPEQSTKERAKKVRFSELVTIHDLEAWGFASQEARDGSCWMEMARDRERFKRRVETTEKIISPCLTAEHRARVLDRFMNYTDSIPAVQ